MIDALDRFDNDVVFRTAREGIEIEADMASPIGRLVLERALDEAHDALVQLIVIDPENAKAVRALQNTVRRASDMCRWIKEVMDSGRAAEQQLEERDGLDEDEAPGHPGEGEGE